MLESWREFDTLKLALSHKDPACLARLYAGIDPSPGQVRFLNAMCSQAIEDKQLVAKVMRGGGKTKCAAIAFAWLLLRDPTLRVFVLSGAYWQARRLYQYFLPLVTNPELFPESWLVGEPTQYLTLFRQGGGLEVLTSSQRRIRGGHVDVLCIDEAVLVRPDQIDAVWPVVRTSTRPKRIVMSTPSHETNFDWFLELWQNARRLGFRRHEWTVKECQWINKEDTKLAAQMLDSQTFRIEYLGEIAERKGRVWDGALIDNALVNPHKTQEYPEPAASSLTDWAIGLDWGFIHPTVITVFEKQGETVYIRDCRIRQRTALSEIMNELVEDFQGHTIYTDSAGVHENDQLARLGVRVIPIVFSKEKNELIGHVRWRLEQGLLRIPNPKYDSTFSTLVRQMNAYAYDEQGKPRKVNDDCVDSMLCAMKRYLLGFRYPSRRVFTRSF